MRWRSLPLALLGAAVALGGCDDESPLDVGLGPDDVAGVYDITEMSFDPDGSVPGVDILERIDDGDITPRLTIYRGNDRFQIAYNTPEDPPGIGIIEGEYEVIADGVRLTFDSELDANKLILPVRLDLAYFGLDGVLSFDGSVNVNLDSLVELVPEYEEEQFPDPVRGRLVIKFTRRNNQ